MTDEIHALSGAYAVDALDTLERARFERHLGDCAACRDEVESLTEAVAELSVITEMAPPAGLRASVLSGITKVRQLPPLAVPDAAATAADELTGLDAERERVAPVVDEAGEAARPEALEGSGEAAAPDSPVVPAGPTAVRSHNADGTDGDAGADVTSINAGRHRTGRGATGNPWRGLVAAGAAAVLVLGGFTIWRSLDNGNTAPTVAEQVLDAPDAAKVEHSFPNGGTATIVRSPSLGKAVLVGTDLPALPEGKTYQLWLQNKASVFASAGLVPGSGDQVVVLEGSAADAAGAGLTVEPAGGSKQPTTEPIALYPFSA